MTSQSNRTRLDGGATAIAKFARATGRTALLLAICSSLALVLVGGIAVHSGVLSGGTIGAPHATKNISTTLDPAPAACAAWDRAASAAIGALTGSNVAPTQIEDAKFRLRRARRNCMAGWVDLACGDYQAVLAAPLPLGDGRWHKLKASKACAFDIAG